MIEPLLFLGYLVVILVLAFVLCRALLRRSDAGLWWFSYKEESPAPPTAKGERRA